MDSILNNAINNIDINIDINEYIDNITYMIYWKYANKCRINRDWINAYKYSINGLQLCPKEHLHYFYEELAIVCYYIGRLEEGYNYAENIILANNIPWPVKNHNMLNQRYYLNKLPFSDVINIGIVTKYGYITSNPNILQLDNEYLINIKSVNTICHGATKYTLINPNNTKFDTTNYKYYIDNNFKKITNPIEDEIVVNNTQYNHRVSGLEDVRMFTETQFLSSCRDYNKNGIIHIVYGECIGNTVIRIVPLKVTEEFQVEKNWLPFLIDGIPHFIYSIHPFRLYKLIDNKTNIDCELVIDKVLTNKYDLSLFRGSGAPIKYKDGYLFSIHHAAYTNTRIYSHRLCWIDKEFNNLKFSNSFYFEKLGVEFTLSLCHHNTGLLISYSVEDGTSKLGILPYEIVDQLLEI